LKSLVIAVILLFGLPFASRAQEVSACHCDDYVKIALGTTWYKSSSSHQQSLWHLLDSFETSLDEFNKTMAGDTSGTYAAIFSGQGSFNQADYQKRFTEYKKLIEDSINESYQTSTIGQYPIELITPRRRQEPSACLIVPK
jgi:hypothetical protein